MLTKMQIQKCKYEDIIIKYVVFYRLRMFSWPVHSCGSDSYQDADHFRHLFARSEKCNLSTLQITTGDSIKVT